MAARGFDAQHHAATWLPENEHALRKRVAGSE
jgi:hypothetical protein